MLGVFVSQDPGVIKEGTGRVSPTQMAGEDSPSEPKDRGHICPIPWQGTVWSSASSSSEKKFCSSKALTSQS